MRLVAAVNTASPPYKARFRPLVLNRAHGAAPLLYRRFKRSTLLAQRRRARHLAGAGGEAEGEGAPPPPSGSERSVAISQLGRRSGGGVRARRVPEDSHPLLPVLDHGHLDVLPGPLRSGVLGCAQNVPAGDRNPCACKDHRRQEAPRAEIRAAPHRPGRRGCPVAQPMGVRETATQPAGSPCSRGISMFIFKRKPPCRGTKRRDELARGNGASSPASVWRSVHRDCRVAVSRDESIRRFSFIMKE